uniref:Small ribosomal subunit protein uS13c n=1 Tax=Haptophyceae sp. NIES-3900 TaxID=2748608 RepID=A0A7R6WD76_9EUKA|nr:ribosomal protein S13 [Haptophyceae sp. NIES-3900]
MARISGVDLPRNKRIEIGLTYIYGIGLSRSKCILKEAQVDSNVRCKDLDDKQVSELRRVIDQDYQVEGDLKRITNTNIKRLMDIGSYKGRRHVADLPVRGQRTRTNARSRRGVKKTVAGKKK